MLTIYLCKYNCFNAKSPQQFKMVGGFFKILIYLNSATTDIFDSVATLPAAMADPLTP